jgi:predicted Zn-dependent peptidase
MKKTEIKGLDLTLVEEKLKNGLTVYLIRKENTESIYATFTTKFGGRDICFKPDGKKDFVTVPNGVAHFLEHKMFETENGSDILSLFSNNGVSSNAATSMYKTSYYFDGSSLFEKNLNLLLDFVQSPYFTDSNVEKEKHIIEQEIDMYADNPYRVSFDRLMENIFVNDSSRIPTIGTKESVRSITKEDLYLCYHEFYHPSNMFLVITGNIDIDETLRIIHENQDKKDFSSIHTSVLKETLEPIHVFKEYDTLKMNITVPKLTLGYKFDLKDLSSKLGLPIRDIRRYLSIYAHLKFGNVSSFLENARKDNVIASLIDYGTYETDDKILLILEVDSKCEKEFISRVENELEEKQIDSYLFELKKKNMIASAIYMSENIYSMSQKVVGDIIDFNVVETDVLDHFKSLNYDDFMRVVHLLDFTHHSYVIVNPLSKQINK